MEGMEGMGVLGSGQGGVAGARKGWGQEGPWKAEKPLPAWEPPFLICKIGLVTTVPSESCPEGPGSLSR